MIDGGNMGGIVMKMFEYKGEDVCVEMVIVFEFVCYLQLIVFNVFDMFGSVFVLVIVVGLILFVGWCDLMLQEFGLIVVLQDVFGNYIGVSFFSLQVWVFGYVDVNGVIDQVFILFVGISDFGDVFDYFKIVDGVYVEQF